MEGLVKEGWDGMGYRCGFRFQLVDGLFTQIVQESGKTSLRNHISLEQCTECVISQWFWQTGSQRLASPRVVAQPQVTPHDVL